jgi:hypothetical protein
VGDIITNVTNDLKAYHKHPSNTASKSGKIGGKDTSQCKRTILKGIIFNKL